PWGLKSKVWPAAGQTSSCSREHSEAPYT
ncbi:hypothetical protein VTO73DRAFT_7724, partial [Trametes versicolor]